MGRLSRKNILFGSLLIPAVLLLNGCAITSEHHRAPVENAWREASLQNPFYHVKRKDTLYSIAWKYDLDYRSLAKRNHLKPPYMLKPGQKLLITNRQEVKVTDQHKEPSVMAQNKAQRESVYVNNQQGWVWPTKGPIHTAFDPSKKSKGVDITGRRNQVVRAIGPGVVVYSGAGLRGYGQMVIVKHSGQYLSAYAYNQKLMVREGARVKGGQVIARMGSKQPTGQPTLHFELRRYGKPVDPAHYIKVQS